jgi:hypothetical protein
MSRVDDSEQRHKDKEVFDRKLWEISRELTSRKVTFESLKEQLDQAIIEIAREIEHEAVQKNDRKPKEST